VGDSYPKIRLAAVQAASVFLNREATVEKACALIREAGAHGADVIGFPEGFIPAHPVWTHFHPCSGRRSMVWNRELFKNAVEIPSPATEALCRAVRDARAYVVIGICEKEPGRFGTMYNTLLFIDRRGEIMGRHRKLVPTQGERMAHACGTGDSLYAYPTDFGRLSGLLCGENSNPLAVYTLIARGTNVHVASWPPHFNPGPDMAEIVLIASRALAYQAKAFVINAVGEVSDEMRELLPLTEEDKAFFDHTHGGSSIIGPYGQILAGPMGRGEGILYADADLEDIVGPKIVQDFAGHYNRFDLFELRIRARAPQRLVVEGEDASAESSPTAPAGAGMVGGPRISPRAPRRGAERQEEEFRWVG
jgi:aliphatic nitrilase